MKIGKIDLVKISSINVLLFTPLSTYLVLSSGITLGDVVLFVNLLLIIFSTINEKKITIPIPLLLYILMITLITLIHWAFGIELVSNDFLSFSRYLFYLVYCLYISKNFLNFSYFYKFYKIISILIASYVIFQFISFYLFHFILPINILSFLGLPVEESIYWYDTVSRYSSGLILYRPCGIFVEPAHYVVYQAPILYLLLNNVVDNDEKNKYMSIIILFSILLSGSTTGLIVILFCLFKKLFKLFNKNIFKSIVISLLIFSFGFIFLNSNFGSSVIKRTFSEENSGAINGRFSNIDVVFSNSNQHIIIGNGMTYAKENYVPSYHRIILSYGILGFVCFLVIMLFSYNKCNLIGKKMLILFMLTMIGTLSLFGTTSVLFFSLIFSNYGNGPLLYEKDWGR